MNLVAQGAAVGGAQLGGEALPIAGDQPLSRQIVRNMMKAKVSEQEAKRVAMAYQRMIFFMIKTQRKTQDWKYFGAGVKLGDKATPILWWRLKGAKTYRILYGDLRFKDVKPSELPTTRPVAKAKESATAPADG